MRSTRRPATRGESTTTCCSAVRTVMRSIVEVGEARDSVAGTVRWKLQPTRRSAAPATRRGVERDMVGLERRGWRLYSLESARVPTPVQASGYADHLVRLEAEPPLRVRETVAHGEVRILGALRAIHRLQEEVTER